MHAHRNMWQKMWPKHGFCFDKLLHVHPKGEIIFDNLQNKDISGETNSQFMEKKQVFLMVFFLLVCKYMVNVNIMEENKHSW